MAYFYTDRKGETIDAKIRAEVKKNPAYKAKLLEEIKVHSEKDQRYYKRIWGLEE